MLAILITGSIFYSFRHYFKFLKRIFNVDDDLRKRHGQDVTSMSQSSQTFLDISQIDATHIDLQESLISDDYNNLVDDNDRRTNIVPSKDKSNRIREKVKHFSIRKHITKLRHFFKVRSNTVETVPDTMQETIPHSLPSENVVTLCKPLSSNIHRSCSLSSFDSYLTTTTYADTSVSTKSNDKECTDICNLLPPRRSDETEPSLLPISDSNSDMYSSSDISNETGRLSLIQSSYEFNTSSELSKDINNTSQDTPTSESLRALPSGSRWATSCHEMNLTGKWSLITNSDFKANFDLYLQQLGVNRIARAVALSVIHLTKEEIIQSKQGKSVFIRSISPKGKWERTLIASGNEIGQNDYEPIRTSMKALGADHWVENECWWESHGMVHHSWSRGAPAGDNESFRYLENDEREGQEIYVCESNFYKRGDDGRVSHEICGSITWKYRRD